MSQHSVRASTPTFKTVAEQLFVGLAASTRNGDSAKIPGQWKDFMSSHYSQIANKLDQPPVGITLPGESDRDLVYVCAAQVSRFGDAHKELVELTVAPTEYAVFAHDGHVSELPGTYAAIWNQWLPSSGKTPKKAASLEFHNPTFDPRTGLGGVTVWIPIS